MRFEVNRYLGWPGQAPSYKIGQRIWEQLRDEYARREGADFDIKAFHKKALDIGGVGLDTLQVRAARLSDGRAHAMTSPYQAVLGDGLRRPAPAAAGVLRRDPGRRTTASGRGVFDTVGTPRRWLWPALALLGGRRGLPGLASATCRSRSMNRPGRGRGGRAVGARRPRLPPRGRGDGRWCDEISADARGHRRPLGRPSPRVEPRFDAAVVDGATAAHVDVASSCGSARMRIPVPALVAPRVDAHRALRRRPGRAARVASRCTSPLIGTVYEYAGSFRYSVQSGGAEARERAHRHRRGIRLHRPVPGGCLPRRRARDVQH